MTKLNPAVKFVCLLVVTFVLAFLHSPICNLVFFAVCMVAALVSGVSAKKLLLLLLPILLASVGMFFTGFYFSANAGMPVNTNMLRLTESRFWNGMTHASRVLAFAAGGYLFCLTTDRVQMIRSFQQQFRVPQIFAYGLLAAWGIFPHMMQEFRRTQAAFRARGKNPFPLSPTFLKPLLVKSVRWSEDLACAMESKGFDGREKREVYQPPHIGLPDAAFCLICFGFSIAMLIFR